MSRPAKCRTSSLAIYLLAIACSFAASGCALMRPRSSEQSGAAPVAGSEPSQPPSDVQQASYDDGDKQEESFLEWEDLSLKNLGKTTKRLAGQGPDRKLAQQLYREAEELYKEAAAAEGSRRKEMFFAAAAKFEEAADRWPSSALEQDALFMTGESYFFCDEYPEANTFYERLIKQYPNNRHLDSVETRRFAIAKYWIEHNRENPEQFWSFNWFDETRPWRDSRGQALRVLDKIRIDDPTGRLADDATLAAANEHFASGKWTKADDWYTDLRQAYPTSEHQFLAHYLGLKAKLNSYMGPDYSANSLDEAEKLIKQIRRQFPNEAAKESDFLDRAAAEIRYKKAEKVWNVASYYDKRGEYRAAAHHYRRIAADFSDTPFSSRSDQRLAEIGQRPAVPAPKAQWLVDLLPKTDRLKPFLEANARAKAEEEAQMAQQPPELGETLQR